MPMILSCQVCLQGSQNAHQNPSPRGIADRMAAQTLTAVWKNPDTSPLRRTIRAPAILRPIESPRPCMIPFAMSTGTSTNGMDPRTKSIRADPIRCPKLARSPCAMVRCGGAAPDCGLAGACTLVSGLPQLAQNEASSVCGVPHSVQYIGPPPRTNPANRSGSTSAARQTPG